MEVKPDYKQTEVGVIPEDWEIKPLHTLADKIMVGIASAATHAYRKRGVVMFRNQNIKPGYLDDMDVLYIDEVYERTFRNKRLKAGDLLTARTGYPGTTSIVPAQYEGAQSFTTLITRPRHSLVDSEYLCFFINSEAGQTYFDHNQIGGGQKNVNAGSLKHLAIPLPPTRAEQQAIAEALGDADALIESLEQLLTKKRQIKKGAIQELLTGKKRLPDFSGAWTTRRIDEISDVDPENLPSTTKQDFKFNYISLEQVDSGRLLSHSEVAFGTAPSRARRVLRHGDVLMSTVRPNLKAHLLYLEQVPNAVCSTGFAVLRTKSNVSDPGFLFAHLFGHAVNEQIEENLAGSNYPAINSRDVRRLEIACPPNVEEQTAIATILSDMDAEITALKAKLSKAHLIKQGMMQELLTGRIRLV